MIASVERKVQERNYAPFRKCRELCRPALPASMVLRIFCANGLRPPFTGSASWCYVAEGGCEYASA